MPSFVLSCLVAGCPAQIPESGNHKLSYQKRLQSAEHWNVLAKNLSNKIATHIQKSGLTGHSVYVVLKSSRTPFNHAFNQLLKTHLFNAGIDITENPQAEGPYANGSLLLTYNTQIIDHHDPLYVKPPSGVLSFISQSIWARSQWAANENPWLGGLPLLGIAVGEELVGGLYWGDNNLPYVEMDKDDIPSSELIINVSLQKDGIDVFRKAAIYYVNDAHFSYATTSPYNVVLDKKKEKTFIVVNQ